MFSKLQLTIIFGLLTILTILLGAIALPGGEKNSSVQGVTTSETPSEPNIPGRYEIYTKPDTTSEIIYFASEGEKLIVLNEQSGWYKVLLNDQRTGWLSAGDVYSRETVDQ